MKATFNVERMMIKYGLLWMGWPNNIGKALDELEGIISHSFELETRIFSVDYDSKVVSKQKIVKAIEPIRDFKVINWESIDIEKICD